MPALSSELFFGIPVGIFILALVGYNLNYSVKRYLRNGKNLIFLFYMVFLGLFVYQLIAFMGIVVELGKAKSFF
ncbi:MAG: hypothetical protein ACQEQC_08725 [Elusimicrobiota bacterium]